MRATADLCDDDPDVLVVEPGLRDLGGRPAFEGVIETVQVFEDNVLVRQALSEPGLGRVLVVDGGGSMRCALVGDQLAKLALDHGWSGIVVHGCVRDAATLATLDLGVRALGTHPRKSVKKGEGSRGVPVTFGGVTFTPGQQLVADADGIVLLR